MEGKSTMAVSQPWLQQPRPSTKVAFSYDGKCKVTMNCHWIDIQSKLFIGVISPPTLNGLHNNYWRSTKTITQP